MADSQSFEGQEISEFIAALPPMKLEAPESYQRGTYLTLNVEVRVRSVRYEEITTGKRKGDLQKIHMLAIENVTVEQTVTPAQHREALEKLAGSGSQIEPVDEIAVSSNSVDADQHTPDTLTVTAVTPVTETDEWSYESVEYTVNQAPVEVGVGF